MFASSMTRNKATSWSRCSLKMTIYFVSLPSQDPSEISDLVNFRRESNWNWKLDWRSWKTKRENYSSKLPTALAKLCKLYQKHWRIWPCKTQDPVQILFSFPSMVSFVQLLPLLRSVPGNRCYWFSNTATPREQIYRLVLPRIDGPRSHHFALPRCSEVIRI